MSFVADSVPAYVGSIHKYGDGYGYGIRVPTSRNIQTKPAAVPIHRYPPDSARFLRGTTCTPLIKNDDRAHQRLADQMVMQTSGDYGKFLVDTDSKAVKLNSGKIPMQVAKRPATTANTSSFNRRDSGGGYDSSRIGTPLEFKYNASSSDFYQNAKLSGTLNSSLGTSGIKSQYVGTLQSLDRSFDRQSRRDLFAASLPARSNQEQLWCVTGAHRSAEQSKPWTNALRQSGTGR